MNSNTLANTVTSPGGTILWGLVLAVHLLGMAAWLGGAAYALFVLRPSLGLLDTTQRNSVQLQTLRRYFRLVWHVMPLVLITGWAMLAVPLGGFSNPDWHIQAMQTLGVVIAGIFAYAFFGPFRKVRRAIRPQQASFDTIRSLVSVTLLLGILVVVIASLDHSF
ncbi:CopD family protein [Lichenicola sp.]|uniref:CopD family protein n=1 Tax=Lichenicola sp. TaxID=2804529 RepID=UPI003B001285